jgi:hypothetical protein
VEDGKIGLPDASVFIALMPGIPDVRLLILGAWHDCPDFCKLLMQRGVSPDRFSRYEYNLGLSSRSFSDETSALNAAAIRGNIECVRVLLNGRANVNGRYSGYTAAANLLWALQRDNSVRENRLHVMQLLLKAGADLKAPLWVKDFDSLHHHSVVQTLHEPHERDCSVRTLLDEALLSGESKIVELFRRFDTTPKSRITIFGVISNAERGIQQLQSYLHSVSPARGLQRRLVEDASLGWCVHKRNLETILAMIQAGFDARLLVDELSLYLWEPGFLDDIFSDRPLTKPSKELATYILRNRQGSSIEDALIHTCLRSGRSHVFNSLLTTALT